MAHGPYRHPEALPESEARIPYEHKKFSPNMAEMNRILKREGIISHTRALYIDQGTLNCYCRRKFLAWSPQGYRPTQKWHRAMAEYNNANIIKNYPSEQLGKYVRLLHNVRSLRATA